MLSAVFSLLTVGVFAFVGGWQRRWISDDGLIVLRTVRNLLAGHGPVFNIGERVEANTSTLWQYLIYLVALFSDARLEMIAMWLALIFTTAALAISVWATAGLHRGRRNLLLLPAGGIIYLALPPARDFATSGLEWGLSLLWIAVLWWLLVRWVQPRRTGRHHLNGPGADTATYLLAFWCGLSWLVRPELALYGGLTGIVLLVAAHSWRQVAAILTVALPVPAAYQFFRMGYYGLITPHTAVAKSASESEWARGWGYVLDLTTPYGLWLALGIGVVIAGVTGWRVLLTQGLTARAEAVEQDTPEETPVAEGYSGRMRLRTPLGVIALIVLAAALHVLYVIRVGGDFMHGRMLLLPLFALLLPIAVVPVLDLSGFSPRHDLPLIIGLVALVWWAVAVIIDGHDLDWGEEYADELVIVDERDFWTYATNREQGDPPLLAEDFLSTDRMNNFADVARWAVEGNGGQMLMIGIEEKPGSSWITTPRIPHDSDLNHLAPGISFINLGMTSMNTPLELRVLDTVGLSTPLAARQPRDEDGRVGHDKWLPLEWQIADSPADIGQLPPWVDRETTALARQALRTPEIAELLASYRAPLTPGRFLDNIAFSLTDGRTLELSSDPRDYVGAGDGSFGDHGPQIAWPAE